MGMGRRCLTILPLSNTSFVCFYLAHSHSVFSDFPPIIGAVFSPYCYPCTSYLFFSFSFYSPCLLLSGSIRSIVVQVSVRQETREKIEALALRQFVQANRAVVM